MSTATSSVSPPPRPPKPTVTYREGWHQLIPAELKARVQWVVWRYEWSGKKWTKVPYRSGRPDRKASSTNPSSWSDFAAALACFHAHRDRIDGVGFVFSAEDEYAGVDFDHCLGDDGCVLDWAEPYMARFRTGYGEISPSGRGIKVIVRGVLPGKGSKKTGLGPNGAAVEMYDRGRFFTITGDAVEGTPDIIPDLAEVITATHRQLFPPDEEKPPKQKPAARAKMDRSGMLPDDEALLDKARSAKNGAKFCALYDRGETSGHDGDPSRADFALCGMLAFYWGPDAAAIDRMFRRSALYREDKWNRSAGAQTYGELTVSNVLEGKTEFYTPPLPGLKSAGGGGKGNAKPPEEDEPTAPTDDRPAIEINPERHTVVEKAVAAIALDTTLFYRGESLVVVAREESDSVKLTARTSLKRMAGSPKIVELSDSNVGCLLTRNAEFFRWQKDKNGESVAVRVHPPDWAVKAVATRKYWHGVRRLVSVVECPYPRADGSIVEAAGYDPDTGTLYVPTIEYPPVPDHPTREDAGVAWFKIRDVFREFPFASEDDRVVPFATLLTVIGRPAIEGPVPGTAVVSNKAGTGKGLLINAVGRIAYGRDVATSSYPDDKVEAQKVKVSIALQAPIAVHFDNLDEGTFYGNSALDSMITASSINDRILGSSKHTGELPVRVVPMLSGNNVSPGKDAHRRWMVCNLATELERPEERHDLEVKDLKAHILERRGELVQAAMTILRAHALAGWPSGDWAPLGSFEEWDRIIRGAVWFATGRDCCTTRRKAADDSPARQAKLALLAGWAELPGGGHEGRGVTAAKAVELVDKGKETGGYATLRNALMHFGRDGKLATSRSIGFLLRGMKGNVTDGMKFVEAGEEHKTTLWKVLTTITDDMENENGGGTYGYGGHGIHPPARDLESHSDVIAQAGDVQRNRAETETCPPSPPSPPSGGDDEYSGVDWDADLGVPAPTTDGAPVAKEDMGKLANNGMCVSGLRTMLSSAEAHALHDLLPRIIAGGMWRDFVFSDGARYCWGPADFLKFLETPRPQGGCESSLPLIERLIGGTPAWAALQAVIVSGDDDTPPVPPDAGQHIANGEAIRRLVTTLSLAGYVRNVPKMFLRMIREGSWRKYLTRDAQDQIKVHRRGAADFREFVECPWPGGLGSSIRVLERVLRDTDAWPVYQRLIAGSPPAPGGDA